MKIGQLVEYNLRNIFRERSYTIFFFYLGFLSRTFTNHRTAGEGGEQFFNSSLPLPPASQTLRRQPGNYCKELTSAHSQQLEQNREPLASERKSLTTKLRALKQKSCVGISFFNKVVVLHACHFTKRRLQLLRILQNF